MNQMPYFHLEDTISEWCMIETFYSLSLKIQTNLCLHLELNIQLL